MKRGKSRRASSFDCLAFKKRVQAAHWAATKHLSLDELAAHVAREVDRSPLGPLARRMPRARACARGTSAGIVPACRARRGHRCPECGKGMLRRVVASMSVAVGARRVRVPGLLALECDGCGARAWPRDEVRRAELVAAVKVEAA